MTTLVIGATDELFGNNVPDTNGGSLSHISPSLTHGNRVFGPKSNVNCLKATGRLLKEPPFVPDTFISRGTFLMTLGEKSPAGRGKGKVMALINEILLFSTTLPVWQQDAIRRLFLHGDFKPQDYDDLLYQTQEGNPSHILIQGERGDF